MTANRHPATDYGPTLAQAAAAWLFLGGCQRSGTSAMVHLLNVDERIVIGLERFKYVRTPFSTLRYAPPIFFNPVPQETNGLDLEMYEMLRERWVAGGVRYLGDKNPIYVRELANLAHDYSGCRLIMMLRDPIGVANSFHMRATNPRDHWPPRNDHRRAIALWNDALQRVQRYMKSGGNPLFIADYEALFAGDERQIESLYRFLDLDVPDSMRRRCAVMREEWPTRAARPLALPEAAAAEVEAARDRKLERWARDTIARQLES